MTQKKCLAVVFLLMLYSFLIMPSSGRAGTTGKIVGKVTDVQTGEPLVGTNVVIDGTTMGAATDVDGDYFIINVPPGSYKVSARMMGYVTMSQTNVNVSIDHTTRVNFQLQETILETGESVTVVAERPLVERDETATRHFVQAEEIAARPANNLSQILSTMPGIDQSGGELVVRRGTLDQVAFLIDGMRARNPLDFQPYQNVNLTSIQELEIITGGFSAEYGEAQSGIFNIVTKEGSDKLEGYGEFRWTPPGQRHWGTALYDYSTTRYWENTHARHLEWWIENPNQWVDANGVYGNDPQCDWTPEQAYQDYMNTHQPLTDYTNLSGYQGELSLGGPLFLKNLHFFVSAKYRTAPPVMGTSFLEHGTWFDGSAKMTYRMNENIKFMFSSFYGKAETDHGMENVDFGWSDVLQNKYVYYDIAGFPKNSTNGQTIKFTHVLNSNTFYDLQLSRIYQYRAQTTFPGDESGWEEGTIAQDRLRAVDENGTPISEAYGNAIGLHYRGYLYRGEDENTDYTFSGDMTSQVNKNWQMKSGFDFTTYTLDRYQEAKFFNALEDKIYSPYEGNIYLHNKLEFEGLIMNLGLRYDFYNPNDKIYLDPFDPFDYIRASLEEREPNARTENTKSFGQLSPRLGVSHPISDKTVLHFNYGHFFQRANFGDYGEGTGGDSPSQRVTGILNTYLFSNEFGPSAPYNLGNRNLKPRKTVQYELGIERNFGGLIVDATAFYKDITNTIRDIRVITLDNGFYITTGNADYADAKGVELAIRKPLAGHWGGYLNYTWSTGIAGTSGDPEVIIPPGSTAQIKYPTDIGDVIVYDPPRLKFGLVFLTPTSWSAVAGLFANWQLSIDYQIYYPHERITSHVLIAEHKIVRPPDRNADVRLRKEFKWKTLTPAVFVEMRNMFNDQWINLELPFDSKSRVEFINSNLSVFPDRHPSGGPFPDIFQYRNLPRTIVLGFALGF